MNRNERGEHCKGKSGVAWILGGVGWNRVEYRWSRMRCGVVKGN